MCKWTIPIQIGEKSQHVVPHSGPHLLLRSWIQVHVLACPGSVWVPLSVRKASSSSGSRRGQEEQQGLLLL